MRILVILLSLALLTLQSGTALAKADECSELEKKMVIDTGVVIDMDIATHAIELRRKGQRTVVGFFTELKGGDRIRIVTPGVLTLQRANGEFFYIREAGKWFCVLSGPRLSWWDNARSSVGEMLTSAKDGVDDLLTRNDEAFRIAPQDVAAGIAQIDAGKRHLSLSWLGGEAPFTVTISQRGQSALVAETDINARLLRIMSTMRDVAPGIYTVEVRDANGHTATGGFTASGRVQLPNGSHEAISRAGVLLATEPTQSYEALLLLGPYRSESKAASDLMDVVTRLK